MKSRLILLLLAAHAGAALAQYKCTGANGAITFQQTPCVGAKSEEKLVVIPNGHPPPASAPAAGPPAKPVPDRAAGPGSTGNSSIEGTVNKRMLASYGRQHEREALVREVEAAGEDKARRAAQRAQAADAAEKQFGDDPNNASALRDALAAIDNRYRALSEIDDRRTRAARSALDDWDAREAKAAAEATAALRK